MRFMALENFFFGGELHEATPLQPKIFDFPDDEVPSARWRPLDAKARKALEDLAEKTERETAVGGSPGNKITIHAIPREFAVEEVKSETIKKPVKPDPDALHPATVAAVAGKGAGVVAVKKGSRPSDSEPT